LDFGPAPAGTVFPRENLEHLKKSRGTVWIDEEDRHVSQWKAWIVDGPLYFEQIYQRLEKRVWSPLRLHYDFHVAPTVLGKSGQDWTMEWKNPKRFSVSVEQTVETPR
jgi:hypothetical protein